MVGTLGDTKITEPSPRSPDCLQVYKKDPGSLDKSSSQCRRVQVRHTAGPGRISTRMQQKGKEEKSKEVRGKVKMYYVYIRKTDPKPITQRSLTFPERRTRNW